MTERSPARLLAPVALVAIAVALFVVVSSPSGEETTEPAAAPRAPAATETPAPERDRDREAPASGETYTIEAGDTPLAIAEKTGVPYEELIAANPGLDANALTVGDELNLP